MKHSTPFPEARRSGFTLIELLVVIAIIAILAAILFPVFAQAREKARAISCLSNTNQLGKSIMMYVQDYDETLPYWNFSKNADGYGGNGHFENWWFNATYPYNKSVQVLRCPDDNTKLTPRAWFKTAGWTSKNPDQWGINPALLDAPISYGMSETMMCGEINGNWGSSDPTQDKSAAVTLAALQKPAQTMALADCIGMTGGTIYSDTRGWGNLPDPNNPNDASHNCLIYKVAYPNQGGGSDSETSSMQAYGYSNPCNQTPAKWDSPTRHSLGSNLTMCDGHSKWLRNSAIKIDYMMGTQAQ